MENFSRVTDDDRVESAAAYQVFRARRHMRACLSFFTAHAGRRRQSVAHGHYKLIRLSTDDAATATAVAPHYTKRTAAAAATSSNAVSGRNAQRFARSFDCGVPESRAITGGMSAIAWRGIDLEYSRPSENPSKISVVGKSGLSNYSKVDNNNIIIMIFISYNVVSLHRNTAAVVVARPLKMSKYY